MLHRSAGRCAGRQERAASSREFCSTRLPVRPRSIAASVSTASTQPTKHAAAGTAPHSDAVPEKKNGAGTTAEPAPAKVTPKASQTATLLVQCPDAKGVVASLSQLLYGFGCNIVSSDQFSDLDTNTFFQRITFDFSDIVIGPGNTAVLERAVAELATRFNMTWKISYRNKLKRVALLVSKLDHCLYDLLIRHRSGELHCEIPIVISNHPDLEHVATMFGVRFAALPVTTDKATQEAAVEELLKENNVDTIILARYMQIFSKDFCDKHWDHTINIHHSFLPAFEGAKPYHRAHERGVKIIGATAHYATDTLDAGPIIDQNTTRITHKDSIKDMIRKGRDLERLVLARAVRWHLDDRVLVFGNKTVVFED